MRGRIHRLNLSAKERKLLLDAGFLMLQKGLLLDRAELKAVVEVRCAPLVDRWIDSGEFEAELLEHIRSIEAEARKVKARREQLAELSHAAALQL